MRESPPRATAEARILKNHPPPAAILHHAVCEHIARATSEAVCFQMKAILDTMETDSGRKLTELAVNGSMSNSAQYMQAWADIGYITILPLGLLETTAMGADIAAGFTVEVWKGFSELKEVNTRGQTAFEPKLSAEKSERMFRR